MALKYNPISGQFDLVDPSKWTTDSPGILYAGHISIGADAAVDATGPFNSTLQGLLGVGTTRDVVSIYEVMTGTADTYNNALAIKTSANFTGNAAVFGGFENTTITDASYTGDIVIGYALFNTVAHYGSGTIGSGLYGTPALVYNNGVGTVTAALGMYSQVNNTSTGTITSGFGLQIAGATNTGGGTFTNNYGLRIEAQTAGSTNYNLYSAGSFTNNYFEGYVRTAAAGGFYMNALGSINNRFKINEPTTAVSAAECIITPSTTARIPMVYQGLASQSANLNEWQDSTGAVLASMSATGVLTFGTDTTLYRSAANTLRTNARLVVDQGVVGGSETVSDATSITPSGSYATTQQTNTQSAGTLTINAISGTPVDGQEHLLVIKSTNVQTFSWNAIYGGSTDTPLPTATYGGSTWFYAKFRYNSTASLWHILSVTDGY